MTLPERRFIIIRHGETEANRDGIIAGRTETPLTEAGRRAAHRLSHLAFPAAITVFTSPQGRASETAGLAFPTLETITIDELRERDWGDFEGRPVSELPSRTSTPAGGEAWAVLLSRIEGALSRCMTLAGDNLPIIVGHSGGIRAARALTGHDFNGPSAPNTTPIVFSAAFGSWTEQPWMGEE